MWLELRRCRYTEQESERGTAEREIERDLTRERKKHIDLTEMKGHLIYRQRKVEERKDAEW